MAIPSPTTGTLILAALASGSGALGGTLTASTVSGVATFASLVLTGTVGKHTINFTSGALTGVTTGAIAVSAGNAAALAFSQQPSTSIRRHQHSRRRFRSGCLTVRGTWITTATTSITIAIGNNPGTSTLGGSATQSASAGVAVFPGVWVAQPGGYRLHSVASGGALTPATSTGFDITPAAASALAFIVQPGYAEVAGVAIAPALQVEVRDALGNRGPRPPPPTSRWPSAPTPAAARSAARTHSERRGRRAQPRHPLH